MRFHFALLVGAVFGLSAPAQAQVYAAWTQANGTFASGAGSSAFVDMNLSLRVVIETNDPNTSCPAYAARLTRNGMATSEPLAFSKRTNNPDSNRFPVIVCEAAAPTGVTGFALVQSVTDTSPVTFTDSASQPVILSAAQRVGASGPPTFVAFGDTGCRGIYNARGAQECAEDKQKKTKLTKFMFKEVAEQAAALNPDFVVHLGDYRYEKESNRTMDMWDSDFFERVRLGLLAQVPWVFVRGNHEECSLAGLGWFFFFAADQSSCGTGKTLYPSWYFDVADRSAGNANPHRFVIIDTAPTVHSSGRTHTIAVADMSDAVNAAQSTSSAWFLMHKPLWAVDDYPNPPEQADHRTGYVLQAAMNAVGSSDCTTYNYQSCGLKAVLAAHLHILQNSVAVGGALPQQIVVGNSGVRMDHAVAPQGCSFSMAPLGFGRNNATALVLNVRGRTTRVDNSAFGFAHFTRDSSVQQSGWAGLAYYVDSATPQPLGSLSGTASNTRLPCQHN
ncbi:metallophosphoesterase [uncultured Tateyamaria sp.]|uniref:metallophosphoesterase n=1 Tax=Tateyamaria sp. 1078 TaxID=3417464 RepID=UPI00260DEED7|nr:metallophosphoesterase [uncultured Tateyamaria sp.]